MTVPEILVLLLLGTAHGAAPTDTAALLRAGDPVGALAAARREASARPDDLAAQELLIDLRIALGDGVGALQDARAQAAAHPGDADLQYLVGRATNDPQLAAKAYQAALAIAPGHVRATMGLASVSEARGQLTDALAGYSRAVQQDPSLAEAWVGRVRLLRRLGRTAEALQVARAALAVHPTESALVLALADLDPPGAPALLEGAARKTPDDPQVLAALAERRLAAGDARGAAAAAASALRVDPTSVAAGRTLLYAREIAGGRLDLAGRTALESLGSDPAAAVTACSALVAKYPRSALARLARADARKANGDAGAADDLLAAADLDPTNPEAAAAAGMALLGAGRAADAEPLLRTAAVDRAWDASVVVAWIRAMAGSGHAAEALEVATVQAWRFPRNAPTQLVYGQLLANAGRPGDAYAVARAALLATHDPSLAALFVQVAPAAGHPDEAAALLDQIVAQTGNPDLAAAARKLRERP